MADNLTGTDYPRSRERGHAPWEPRDALRTVLDDVNDVLGDLVPRYGPQGNRGVAYRLTGTNGYAKDDKLFRDVNTVSNRGRRAGLIEWGAINDPSFVVRGDDGLNGLASFHDQLRKRAAAYRRDRQEGQSIRKLIWVEAAGVVGMVDRFAREFGVPVLSGGGVDSTTGKRQIALELAASRVPTRIGVIADHDQHGLAIADSRAEDVSTFVHEFVDGYTFEGEPMGGRVEWEWLAVRPDQIDKYDLPSKPTKAGKQWVGDNVAARVRTVQVEALHPSLIRRIVRDFIAKDFDHRAWWDVMRRERPERERAVAAVDRIDFGEVS